MTTSPESHAQNWDLRHPDFNDNDLLYDVYTVMRQGCPFPHTDTPFLADTPGGAWIAVNYDDCYRIAQDWEHFSNNPVPGSADFVIGDLVVMMDPPRQQKLRKVLNPYFSPAQMKALRPQVTTETDLLIDDFIGAGAGDLARVAWRQPGIVLFKYLLGIPAHDVGICFQLTDDALNGATEDIRMTAWGGLYQYIHDTVTARIGQPSRGDMIDILLAAEIDGERLPIEDAVANAMLLVQAGLETTASAMSFAFHHLATHPGERDRLAADPDLLPRAVEELIRYAGSIHGLHRTVTKDVELSGHTFHAGDTVVVNFAAANRDDNVFPDANRCVLDRRENRHLGFGAGVHRCLGSNLARLEFQIGVERVLSRLPDFRLATGARPDFHGNSITRGFRTVPVEFSPGICRHPQVPAGRPDRLL
ncbi:cytochrome P450 [Mycolicibacterium fluoranthenivorans]|uniref:Cytochrome P450 n=1 Tax=Mycolicibacterium fluoranthenivorans TaxID=258505 RepID=A0A7X5U1U7_9MYCO|nr:cytochrome P450 [Mycolicibacterium fluoranthenivorans]MCV7359619.1 cytochrome P450 [Mycolicibacterium fluoranthenivorans]NIH96849.1 cytochrome P450 [Mycolicibacterium fluoranthenivorans]